MYPIWKYGNEEQRQKYLPKLASGEYIGCFGLTEPDFGSNPEVWLQTSKTWAPLFAKWCKMWISNAPFADIAIVWAKNEEGRIKGLIAERGMEGFSHQKHTAMESKSFCYRRMVFDNVKIPKENILPNKDGLGAPLGCLDSARYGIAWGACGQLWIVTILLCDTLKTCTVW